MLYGEGWIKMKIVIRRFVVVILFLVVALWILNRAPEYDLEYKYKDGDIRVIFNDVEITRELNKLPQTAILVDGEVMLSQDTVDILLDKNLYYEEKYQTFITTTTEHRADLKVNSKVMEVDGKSKNIKIPPMEVTYRYQEDNRYEENDSKREQVEKIIYLPIKALEEVYDITVEFKDKVIITENNRNRMRFVVKEEDEFELKHAKNKMAKNVEVIGPEDYIDIFDYDANKEFLLARSYTGEIGYISQDELKDYEKVPTTIEKEPEVLEKVNIAWDYIGPNATNIGEKGNRSKNNGLDVVAPTLLYLKNETGEIRYNQAVVNSYLEWAERVGYRVWVTLKNEYANQHFTLDETSTFLNDMQYRKRAITEMIDFVKKNEVEGINIDIEYIYQKDATAFSQFIRELCVAAKQNHVIISVCVNVPDGSANWSLCYQHKALSEYANYLAVMTYDQYGPSSNVPGPNASLDWVIENIEKIVNRDKVESQKVLLGIPFYSRLWKTTTSGVKQTTLFMAGAKEYLNKSDKAIWVEDAGQYYYENADGTACLWIEENESIAKKLALIKEYQLGGSAYWMLGYETEDIWQTIVENLEK